MRRPGRRRGSVRALVERKGKLVVITGPSGVGKSTIVREVLRRTGAEYSVSVTTRSPRPGEVDGRDYRFVDDAEFDRMIADGELLEWAQVFGRRYGTPAPAVRDAIEAGRTVVLEIDVQGGLQVHRAMPEGQFVLIVPPGSGELERRLRGRGSEVEGDVARRLKKANDEIAAAKKSGAYNHVVVNDDLEQAIARVVRIVEG